MTVYLKKGSEGSPSVQKQKVAIRTYSVDFDVVISIPNGDMKEKKENSVAGQNETKSMETKISF